MRPKPVQLLEHREFPVLYVDDEVENLRVFELTFRREFSILTAQSAEEGMRVLNENPIAVVLSDHKMPGMTGVEFLSRVREIDPKAMRVLVTAYGDAEILGNAINDGSIYRYIPKPWEPGDMRLAIRQAIDVYALDRERDALLRELTQLSQLSRAMHRELDLDRLLQILLDATHRELGFDGAALLFFDASGDALGWAGIEPSGSDTAARVREIEIHRGNAPHFVERLELGSTVVLGNDEYSELEAPIRQWVTEVAAAEILVVPLVGKAGTIGAIAIDNRGGGHRFGADDRTLLDGLATQAVVAIENARLVEDLRRSREQVLRADRLGTLGTLAAGLAHEINNPLVSIHTFLSLAPEKRDSQDSEFWGDYHQLACTELDRIRDLIATMSKLGRGEASQTATTSVDLAELASEAITLTEREASSRGVTLVCELQSDAPEAVGVRSQLHQVVLNLLLNAVHATSPGGRIAVRVGPATGTGGSGVRLEVEDSGVGIAPEHLDRVFDPFFTTKEPDEGTGLGLMICDRIVSDHGGQIEVRSHVGQGSVFTVTLPVASAAADTPPD